MFRFFQLLKPTAQFLVCCLLPGLFGVVLVRDELAAPSWVAIASRPEGAAADRASRPLRLSTQSGDGRKVREAGFGMRLGPRAAFHSAPTGILDPAFSGDVSNPGTKLWIDVRDYGAKGDEKNDDTESIQRAIHAASSSGGLVVFPIGSYLISSPLDLAQGVALLGLGSPQSTQLRIVASSSFPLDQPMIRNHTGGVMEGVLIENLLFNGNDRADGVWFNGLRSSMMKNVIVQGVTRPNDYGFRVMGFEGADASNDFFYGLRTIVCWGGLYMAGTTSSPALRNAFFGTRFQAIQRGIFLDTGGGSPSVQGNGFFNVMIDTTTTTAVGIEDRGYYNHFEDVVAENSVREGSSVGLIGGAGAVYLNMLFNSYITSHKVSPLSLLTVGADFARARTAGWIFFQTSDPTPATLETTQLFSRLNGEMAIRVGSGRVRELATKTELNGLSATSMAAKNFRGSLTLSGPQTSEAVRFGAAESDSGYFVVASVSALSGKPASGSTRVFVTDKSTSGFTVHLESAPGAGNSITVDWILIR